MNYRTQQGHEQTWRFHAHLPIYNYNKLIYNNLNNICTHEY